MGAHYRTIDSRTKLIGSQPTLTDHLAHNHIVIPLRYRTAIIPRRTERHAQNYDQILIIAVSNSAHYNVFLLYRWSFITELTVDII